MREREREIDTDLTGILEREGEGREGEREGREEVR